MSEKRNFPKVQWVFIVIVGYMLGIEAMQFNALDPQKLSKDYFFSISKYNSLKIIFPMCIGLGAFFPPILMRIVHDQAVFWLATYLWLSGAIVAIKTFNSLYGFISSQVIKGISCGMFLTHLPLVIYQTTVDKHLCVLKYALLEASYNIGIVVMSLVAWETSIPNTYKWIYVSIPIFFNCLFVFFLPINFRPTNRWSEYPLSKQRNKHTKCFKLAYSHLMPVVTGQQQLIWNRTAVCASMSLPNSVVNICCLVVYAVLSGIAFLKCLTIRSFNSRAVRQTCLVMIGCIHLILLVVNLPWKSTQFETTKSFISFSILGVAYILGQLELSLGVYAESLPTPYPVVYSTGVFLRFLVTTILSVLPQHYTLFIVLAYLCFMLFIMNDIIR